jgi:hypothetical protein
MKIKFTLLFMLFTLLSFGQQGFHEGDFLCDYVNVTVNGQETVHYCSQFPGGVLASDNRIKQYYNLRNQGWEIIHEETNYGTKSYYRRFLDMGTYVKVETKPITTW